MTRRDLLGRRRPHRPLLHRPDPGLLQPGALTVEDVRDHFEEIDDTSQFTVPWQATDETFLVRDLLMPRES